MKKSYKIGGGYYYRLLCLFIAMSSASFAAWAQGGSLSTQTSSAATAGSTSTGVAGYSIAGETHPSGPVQEYRYIREMPDGSKGVYWHVEGAITINGSPVSTYPAGNLSADEQEGLNIQWDSTAANGSVLQLRRNNAETKAGMDVLASLAVRSSASSGQYITYWGTPSNPHTSGRSIYASPITRLCPNIVDPNTGVVAGEPFSFHFERNCRGNTSGCSARPNFVWTIIYTTEFGNTYQEQIGDDTQRDYSKIYLYMYDRVPFPNTATNVNASRNIGGNNDVFLWVRQPGCGGPGPNSAQPGERIVDTELQCTGYTCEYRWDYSDLASLPSPSKAPQIKVTNSNLLPGQTTNAILPLCRNKVYDVEANIDFRQANSPALLPNAILNPNFTGTFFDVYTWRATNGARFRTTVWGNLGYERNRIMELDLTSVPPNVTSITVTVSVITPCGSSSDEQSLVIPITPGPAPVQSLLLDGRCANITRKNLQVTNVTGGVYDWSVTGSAGAYFDDGTADPSVAQKRTVPADAYRQALFTPNTGDVIVTATPIGATLCNGNGAAYTQTFQVGNMVPMLPVLRLDRSVCVYNSVALSIQNHQPGLTYTMSPPFNLVRATSATITQTVPNVSPTAAMVWNGGSGEFDVFITVSSSCPQASQGFVVHGYVQKFQQSSYCRPALGPGSNEPTTSTASVVLYPNPTDDGQVMIAADDETTVFQWVKVLDAQGRVVQQTQDSTAVGVKHLDLRAVPAGLYQVQLFDGHHLTTRRIVRQ